MFKVIEFTPTYGKGFARFYEVMGESFSPELIKYWCKARKYVKVLLAINNEGEVVGKVTLDLAYKPYAEIVNLMVHPDYRGQGIGKRLIEECVKIAEDKGFYIQYLMTDVSNFIAHKQYHKYGFIPAILPQKIVKGRDMWLFRFSRKTFVIEYLDTHPFTNYNVSKKRVRYMDMKVYRIGWNDVLSQDHLYLYFKGQPGQPTGKVLCPESQGLRYFRRIEEFRVSIEHS